MKRTIPILITMLAGIVLIISNFIPATVSWGEAATIWFDILAGVAFLLGGANLVRVHLKKVSDKHAGWGYSLIVLGTFFLTLGFGLAKLGVKPSPNAEFYGETFAHVPAEALPPSMIYSVPGIFPERLKKMSAKELYYTIPASCREQFTITPDSQFTFKGWMLETQMGDLLSVSELLDWKAAIETLFEKAQPPAPLNSKLFYRYEHEAIAISGVLTPEEEQQLRSLGSTPQWNESIDKALKQTHVEHEFKLDQMLESVVIPKQLESRVKLADKTLKVEGPLSESDYSQLARQFPIIRSITPQQQEILEKELEHLAPLSKQQQEVLRSKLASYNWTAQELIEAINIAGKPQGGTKSYRDLQAERNKGIPELVMEVPPQGETMKLVPEQEAIVQQYVDDATMKISTLIEKLKAIGPVTPAQVAEINRFLSTKPTLGRRNRELCLALCGIPGESLKQGQIIYLMSDYKKELAWATQMHRVLLASNPVKYSWSGAYDDEASVFGWIYEYAFSPLQSTVFAMLAFYVASAAFRAFRAKNIEAILLLSTAFLVLLSRTYVGGFLTELTPNYLYILKIQVMYDWIMQVPYTAGGRAIMIGIALGVISTSLKVLLGIDRSFLGGDD